MSWGILSEAARVSEDSFEFFDFDQIAVSFQDQQCVSLQSESIHFSKTLFIHNFFVGVRVVLFDEEFVLLTFGFDAWDFAHERIVVLVFCNVTSKSLNPLNLEVKSLCGGVHELLGFFNFDF